MPRLACAVILLPILGALGCVAATGPATSPASGSGGGAAPAAPAGALKITPENAKIEFVGSKKDGSHPGGFKQFTGWVELSGNDVTGAKIAVEIEVDSMYTDVEKLTNHLKSPDFFDARKFPTSSFVSTAITPGGEGSATHTVTGNLTLHGVTKPISFPATIALTDDAFTLDSKFNLSRKEFGITYGPGQIHDDVAITVSVRAPRQ